MFPSRTDPDPGNHGRRKVLVATDEIAKRVSHPENLGRSLNTMKQVFRIGKDSKYKRMLEDVVRKLKDPTQEKAGLLTSNFTLLPEGNNLTLLIH